MERPRGQEPKTETETEQIIDALVFAIGSSETERVYVEGEDDGGPGREMALTGNTENRYIRCRCRKAAKMS